ncbi:hypothetical protein Tco_0638464, partial [Tanacetum coccineum]
VKSASTPVDLEKPLVKDGDADGVDVHLYRSMIGSLMYLTVSRSDIMFAICACARFQVTPKTLHLLAVKRIFRYLKGKPTLGLWYSRNSPFELVAYTNSDYARATQDKKFTTRGCQFLGNRLISCAQDMGTKVATVSNSYHLKHCLRGGISKEVRTPRYLSLVVPLTKVGDEAVHKELGDKMERAATTASSLEAEQDSGSGPRCQDTILGDVNAQTRFEITSIQSIDPPLSRGYTLGSGEDSMKLIGIDKILLKLVLSVLVSAVKRMLMLPVQVSAVEVNPVIYTSCIEQFWATAKVHTVNGNTVHVLGNMSTHKKIFVNPFHTKKVFANMKRAGKDFSGRITPLFDTMMVQPVKEMGEDSDHLTDSTLIYIIDQPSSSSQPKKNQPSKKAQRQEAEVPQDEAEHEESIPTPSNDPQPNGEDSMQLTNLMVLCTKLKTQVLDLQKAKDA